MKAMVAVFGSVTRGRTRVALPTETRVPGFATGLALAALVLFVLAMVRGVGMPVVFAAGGFGAGLLFGWLARRQREKTGGRLPPSESAHIVAPDPFEGAPDGMLLATESLRVVTMNRAFRALTGYARVSAGMTVGQVLCLPDGAGADESYLASIGVQPIALDVIHEDGVRVPVEATFARLADGSYQFVVRDGSARRRAESELRYSRAQLQRLTRRMSAGIEEERRRIAREVHDELGQQLIRLKHDVLWLRARMPSAETAERVAALGEVLDETAAIVRRIASELRPSILDELGLSAAVEWQVLDFGRRTGLATSVSLDEAADALESGAATALFRILQEALTNVAKHAAARRVHVRLMRMDGSVFLEVRDNGRGLRPTDVADPSRLGLLGMKERADAFGGSLQVTAMPDAGTSVAVRLPLANIGAMRIA